MTAPALVEPSFEMPRYGRFLRSFTIEGELWEVYEDRRQGPPSHGPSLVFLAERVARRVHRYPDDWRRLSDEQLYALSWLP